MLNLIRTRSSLLYPQYLQIFDKLSQHAARTNERLIGSSPSGFCQYENLNSPDDFDKCASRAIDKCEHLVKQVPYYTATATADSSLEILDEISETICRIADIATFCLNVHPDPDWQTSARNTVLKLEKYISGLNTNLKLFTAVQKILKSDLASDNKFQETRIVAESLYRDFIHGGIDSTGNINHKIRDLCQNENLLSMQFESNVKNPTLSELKKISLYSDNTHIYNSHNKEDFYLTRENYTKIMVRFPDEGIRRLAYINHFTSLPSNLEILRKLIDTRRDRALYLNYDSFAHLKLKGSLAEDPSLVEKFLVGLATKGKEAANEDIKILKRLKGNSIFAWDITYFANRAQEKVLNLVTRKIRDIFKVENCIKQIFSFLNKCFNLEFGIEENLCGHKWSNDISCYKVKDSNTQETIGHLYLDLFSRTGKFQANAHYTIRCGRRLRDGEYQAPIVALVTNFFSDTLTLGELRTLLHEFGHVINSLLCKSRYQHLFGTRGPLDVVEIPSHFFDKLVEFPEMLQYFSSTNDQGTFENISIFETISKSYFLFNNYEEHDQVLFALFDQQIFSQASDTSISTTDIYKDIVETYGVVPYVDGTFKEAWATHLTTYGASYYAYPLSKYISAKAWDSLLGMDPMRYSGWKVVKEKMLRPGGAIEPNKFLENIINDGNIFDSV